MNCMLKHVTTCRTYIKVSDIGSKHPRLASTPHCGGCTWAYLRILNHACEQVRSQHPDHMLSRLHGGAVLEGVLHCDGLGGPLVLHWGGVLQVKKSVFRCQVNRLDAVCKAE